MPTLNSSVRKYSLPAAIGWTLLIAVMCLINFKAMPSIGIGGADKYVHILFHFGFTVLWFLHFQRPNQFDKVLWRVFAASFAYGIAIEIAQELFTDSRHADIYDVIANMSGAFTGVSVIMIGNFYSKRK